VGLTSGHVTFPAASATANPSTRGTHGMRTGDPQAMGKELQKKNQKALAELKAPAMDEKVYFIYLFVCSSVQYNIRSIK